MKKFLLLLLAIFTATGCTAAADGFLFVTFKGETTPLTEQIYFGLSDDGLKWEALNQGEPVLVSTLGEKGVRDPYILRAADGKKVYLIATDLSINRFRDWTRAVQRGSKAIVVWESEDLVKWSEPRLVQVAADDAGCTWAPEAVYDEQTKDYLVFWASKTAADNFAKHRIWAARTKDFKTFGAPFIYIDKPNDIIDTTIVSEGGVYYRISKDEKTKATLMESSSQLLGSWQDVAGFSLDKLRGYEGPTCFVLEPATTGKPATWSLLLDYYSRGQGYQAYITNDLGGGQFTPAANSSFPFRFRHGSVLRVTTEEYARLRAAYSGVGAAK